MSRTEKARIKGQHLRSRITSVSTPFGGVGLKPVESERKVVRDVIVFLEDRRSLYVDYNLEVESEVVSSILKIREALTKGIERVEDGTPAAESFRRLQAECRQFLTRPSPDFCNIGDLGPRGRGGMDAGFFTELGILRRAFGTELARLAYLYDLDLSGDLETILPPEPQPDDATVAPRREKAPYY